MLNKRLAEMDIQDSIINRGMKVVDEYPNIMEKTPIKLKSNLIKSMNLNTESKRSSMTRSQTNATPTPAPSTSVNIPSVRRNPHMV
jgi:hypothetical protein